jgi:hypothetical protein
MRSAQLTQRAGEVPEAICALRRDRLEMPGEMS